MDVTHKMGLFGCSFIGLNKIIYLIKKYFDSNIFLLIIYNLHIGFTGWNINRFLCNWFHCTFFSFYTTVSFEIFNFFPSLF